jgi:hypothetical protein
MAKQTKKKIAKKDEKFKVNFKPDEALKALLQKPVKKNK